MPVFQSSILLFSIALNSLFISFSLIFISRQGGISYIKGKLYNLRRDKAHKGWNINAYYKHKKSQFEILPEVNNSIIFLGDSLTDEGEWAELLENYNIKNRGISGDTTGRISNRLNTIIAAKPQQIFLMVGINDLVNEKKSVDELISDYKSILNEFKNAIPATEVFIQSVLPVNNSITLFWLDSDEVIKFNLKLQVLAKEFNYKYIEIFSHLADKDNQLSSQYTTDGVHLNGQAYLVWKSIVEKYI